MNLNPENDRRRECDGLTAVFHTRAAADLSIEHLAQEYGIDPAFIYVEPVADTNSTGTEPNGGDHACGAPSHGVRSDAPLNGAIQVTLPVEHKDLAKLTDVLRELGAVTVDIF